MSAIQFTLNGAPVSVEGLDPRTTVLEYLRHHAGLPGTKEGCAEGDCGACTVAVIDEAADGGPVFRAINSCLALLPQMHGRRLFTVEGIGRPGALHPAQAALAEALGSQCGYCTPGFVMSLFEATYRPDLPDGWRRDDQICGNLCRCTGYRPIRDALDAVAGTAPDDAFSAALTAPAPPPAALEYAGEGRRFFAPDSFVALFAVLDAHPDARIVSGATDLGLDVTRRRAEWPVLVSLHALRALRGIARTPDGGWSIGATEPLAAVEIATEHALSPLARMLRFFGSHQIKNNATLGGNLVNASPIGDTPPVMLALDARFTLHSAEGSRSVPADAFFVSYRQTAMRPGEILARIEIPPLPPSARVGTYKVSKRREMDISAVAGCFRVETDDAGRVTLARLAFGGMAATPARARAAEAALLGATWDEAAVEAAAQALADDFQPMSDHRGSAWYRATLAQNLLRGFYHETLVVPIPELPARPTATVLPLDATPSRGEVGR